MLWSDGVRVKLLAESSLVVEAGSKEELQPSAMGPDSRMAKQDGF